VFTTRSIFRAAVLLGLAAIMSGCVYVSPRAPAPLSGEPLLVDEAMMQRDFDRSTAWYQNGAVVAGHVPVPVRLRAARVYHGARFEPTHTAQPPLPGEPVR
jgi:hypothetical protein